MLRNLRPPSLSLSVALIALFVALSGTAVAAGIVPLAKRALSADKAKVAATAKQAAIAENAKKLAGQTPDALIRQAAEQPGPASTSAGLVVIKTSNWSLSPGTGTNFTVMCDAGQRVMSGGWADPGDWSSSYQSLPAANGAGWTVNIWTSRGAPGSQSGTVYAMCLK